MPSSIPAKIGRRLAGSLQRSSALRHACRMSTTHAPDLQSRCDVRGPVNVTRLPETPSLSELAALGVARVSWATLLYRDAMAHFEERLASLHDEALDAPA